MSNLQGKVILITGALGMLGSSAVSLFLERGAIVACTDRKPLSGSPDMMQLGETFGEERFMYQQADCCAEAEVIALVADIERTFGRLDGTYHNVYTNVWKPALELTLEEWEDSIRGTLTSTFLLCKYTLPLLIQSGGGSIVNTSSVLGGIPSPGCLPYGTAKAGVNQLTRIIAQDYGRDGIRANVIVPGDFRSDDALAKQSGQEQEAIRRNTWLGRSGRAVEVNEVAAFLLSDAASYVTGSLYTVDGGFHL